MRAALLSLSALACTGAPEPHPRPTDDCGEEVAEIALGTGSEAFEALADGASLPMYFGPQGGYHVYGSIRTAGVDPGRASDPFGPDSPTVSFSLTDGDRLLATLDQQPRLLAGDLDEGLLLGQLVVITGVADPPSLAGTPATFSASITDRCGRADDDARAVVLSLD